jgi:hypothetical protein
VVGKEAAMVMTSSPGINGRFNLGEVKAAKASRFAEEPEFTMKAYLVLI